MGFIKKKINILPRGSSIFIFIY